MDAWGCFVRVTRSSTRTSCVANNHFTLNLLGTIPVPAKHLFKTERLFDFRIARPLARNHHGERTARLFGACGPAVRIVRPFKARPLELLLGVARGLHLSASYSKPIFSEAFT